MVLLIAIIFFGPALVITDPEDVKFVLKNIDDFPKKF